MKEFVIETSARHVHVTDEALEVLFGKGAKLTVKKELSQPGQYASESRVDLVGPKGTIKGVSILGPTRPQNQVEVSLTDARSLGVATPVRESGDIAGSASITIVGPNGSVELSEGLIAAKRHIHMTPEDAVELGVKDCQIVNVKVVNETGRATVFGDTVVRVSPKFALAMHVDTDESNAAALKGLVHGIIVD